MNKKRKANRAKSTGKLFSRPGPAVPLEYLSPEEIAHCNGAPPLLSQEERRQQISILASRQATHGAYSMGDAQAVPNRVNKLRNPQ